MNASRGSRIAILLWVLLVAALAILFVNGLTRPGADGRTEIALAVSERDLVLGEMRELLKAVQRVIAWAGGPEQAADRQAAEQAARKAGIGMAADGNPSLMAKLPLAFKQMGMSVHKDFDGLADAIAQKETPQQILQRLSSITARCTTCHDLYRLPERR
nr:cytochrome c [Nitrospirota bacterium]